MQYDEISYTYTSVHLLIMVSMKAKKKKNVTYLKVDAASSSEYVGAGNNTLTASHMRRLQGICVEGGLVVSRRSIKDATELASTVRTSHRAAYSWRKCQVGKPKGHPYCWLRLQLA